MVLLACDFDDDIVSFFANCGYRKLVALVRVISRDVDRRTEVHQNLACGTELKLGGTRTGPQ